MNIMAQSSWPVSFLFLSDVLGIFCPLAYTGKETSEFSFQAFFTDELVINFDTFSHSNTHTTSGILK
jgi:hypothetical protein